jgi:hypothetical protein
MTRRGLIRTALSAIVATGVFAVLRIGMVQAGSAVQKNLPANFDVVDRSANPGRAIGEFQIDGSGHVSVDRADSGARARLETIASEMNRQETIVLPAPPPPSAPYMALYGFPIARDDPRFLDAMRVYLLRFHKLELE